MAAEARIVRRWDVLIFDWDGTLADSVTGIVTHMQGAIAALGLPARDDAQLAALIGLGIEDALRRLYPEMDTRRLVRRLGDYYRSHRPQAAWEAPLFAGVIDALRGLRAAGYQLAVATGKRRLGLTASLAAHQELVPLLAWTRCADEAQAKPQPAMVLDLLALSGVGPTRALVIGDTEFDVQMARAAGVEAVGVTSGGHDSGRLQAAGALVVLDSVAALPAWLAECRA